MISYHTCYLSKGEAKRHVESVRKKTAEQIAKEQKWHECDLRLLHDEARSVIHDKEKVIEVILIINDIPTITNFVVTKMSFANIVLPVNAAAYEQQQLSQQIPCRDDDPE